LKDEPSQLTCQSIDGELGGSHHFLKPADWQEMTVVLAQLKQAPAGAGERQVVELRNVDISV
jgi:hypothetical protein